MSEEMKMGAERAAFRLECRVCKESSTLDERRDLAGCCWACGHEIDLDPYLRAAMASLPVGVPDGYALVKIGTGCVTSEMKAACIGEFSFGVSMACAECVDVGADEDCPVCCGQIEYTQHIDVPWDTCKEIYKAMLAAAPTVKAEQSEGSLADAVRVLLEAPQMRGKQAFGIQPIIDRVRALLEAPSLPAAGSAVEEVKVVAWRVSHPDTVWKVYERNPESWAAGEYEIQELMSVAQCLRMLDQQRAALSAQQSAPELALEQAGKLLVSAEPLRQVLNALVSAPHMIRELQATREPVALFADNPINVLIAEFNAAHGGE